MLPQPTPSPLLHVAAPGKRTAAHAPRRRRLWAAAASTAGLALHSPATWAHDGHGLWGSHWHASDAFGLMLGVVAVAAVWLWKGKP